jgi:hypothetical protein
METKTKHIKHIFSKLDEVAELKKETEENGENEGQMRESWRKILNCKLVCAVPKSDRVLRYLSVCGDTRLVEALC